MQLAVLGLNHESAPIAMRERVALSGFALEQAYAKLAAFSGCDGAVLLSTCNRTEIYWAGPLAMPDVLRVWSTAVDVDPDQFSDHLYLYVGDRAVTHLFRVATGLDSLVLGEPQILGQVKEAYQTAQAFDSVGTLHRVFLAALRVGKRAHTETTISQNALSMGYAAVELSRKIFGEDLSELSALVVGVGEMGSLVARHLGSAHIGQITVINRTESRARQLAESLAARVEPWTRLSDAVTNADLVVTSTRASIPVIDADMVRNAVKSRRGRAMIFLDLAVPRDVEPGVEQLAPSVFRYDVDDLRAVVQHNLKRRQREAALVERIVEEERMVLEKDWDVSKAGPLIRSLREKAERIRQRELEQTWRRLPHLTEHDRAVVEQATRLMLNKLLNDPMVSIRGWAGHPDGAVYLQALRDLFRLDGESPSLAPKE